jgi:hypothetical protein
MVCGSKRAIWKEGNRISESGMAARSSLYGVLKTPLLIVDQEDLLSLYQCKYAQDKRTKL